MYELGFTFEQWVVTPADSIVSGPYGETRLEPRVMDLLVYLAANSGKVVSRGDLIDSVWGGAVVGDEVLSRCIYLLRRALGESSRDPHFIQTVPKRGYRLNARVAALEDAESLVDAETWRHGSPFRGLQAFDTEHAPVFFGRTRATYEALSALRQQAATGKSFLLLLGASGIGKSSLARAGILFNLLKSQDAQRWYHDVFLPGGAREGPVKALIDSLSRALGLDENDKNNLAQALTDKSVSGDAGANGVLARLLGGEERIVLVADQLEEVFSGSHIEEEQRQDFFDALERLACSGYCWIVSTLRSDFYPHCVHYPALMRLKKGGGHYDVRPMGPTDIQQSIRLPARAAGLEFEHDPEKGKSLDETIYEAAANHPKILPMLEFTLQALYDARSRDKVLTFNAYDKLGGVEGSLALRADDVFTELPPAQQEALPQVMSRLVRLHDDGATAGSCALDELSTQAARQLVQAFVDARLFSIELGTEGSPRVTVTHETLLTQWPRIHNWIDDNRHLIRVRQRVAVACRRWSAESRRDDLLLPRGKLLDEAMILSATPGIDLNADEQTYIAASSRRTIRRRWVERAAITGLVVSTIAAGGFAWQAGMQRNAALEQRAIAERETLAATETADFLLDIFSAADPSEATGGQLTAKRMLDQASARLDSGLVEQAGLRTRLRAVVARAYKGIGLYSDAESLLRQADAEAGHLQALTERDRLEIRYQLADALFQQGDLHASEALHAEVLARRHDMFGDADLDTLASQTARAHELWRDGEIGKAEKLFLQVLETRQDLLGERHELVTDTLSTLGSLYYSQGMLVEAEKYHRAAAEQADETYGERSVRTAIVLSNLGHVESDPAESEALFNRSLAIRREVLGPDHILVARAEEILASFYERQGDSARAEPLYRQAIRKVAMSDERSPALAWFQNSFGRFLESEERFDEAIAMFRESRNNFAKQLGDAHRWTLIVHGNLATAYYRAGDTGAALQEYEEAIAAARSTTTPSELAIADLQSSFAEALLEEGDVTRAAVAILAAIRFYEGDAELHRASLASAFGTYAEALFLDGQAADALLAANRALELGIAGAAQNNSYGEFLRGVILARIGDCPGALSSFDHGISLVPLESRTATQWKRLQPLIEAAKRDCQ